MRKILSFFLLFLVWGVQSFCQKNSEPYVPGQSQSEKPFTSHCLLSQNDQNDPSFPSSSDESLKELPPLSLETALSDSLGKPSSSLKKVLQYFDLPSEDSWPSIIAATQQAWLRKDCERWDIIPRIEKNPTEVFALFSDLSLIQPFHPQKKHYDYALILGATAPVIKQRLLYLKKIWEEGIRFNQIVFLVSDRPLLPKVESIATLEISSLNKVTKEKPPQTEYEISQWLWNQMDLPSSWHEKEALFIHSPMKRDPSGELKRANTRDTFIDWIASHPKEGSCLIISSQPFIGRQHAVARNSLPPSFVIESAGPGVSLETFIKESRATAICLDELARWIYEQYAPSH